MSIKVIRATGMMGGAARVAVKVDNEVVMKLENNEEYTLPFELDEANIKVKQFFFGSKEKKVKDGDIVEIIVDSKSTQICDCECHNSMYKLVRRMQASINQ